MEFLPAERTRLESEAMEVLWVRFMNLSSAIPPSLRLGKDTSHDLYTLVSLSPFLFVHQ
jgi:hypothetical protein